MPRGTVGGKKTATTVCSCIFFDCFPAATAELTSQNRGLTAHRDKDICSLSKDLPPSIPHSMWIRAMQDQEQSLQV